MDDHQPCQCQPSAPGAEPATPCGDPECFLRISDPAARVRYWLGTRGHVSEADIETLRRAGVTVRIDKIEVRTDDPDRLAFDLAARMGR